eukprot:4120611-Heterocapsa_arctica.AAC.1
MVRQACKDGLEGALATGEGIRQHLKTKKSLLHQLDRHFKIEESLFQNLVGEVAEKRLMLATLACLQSTGDQIPSIDIFLQKLNNLGEKQIIKFCGAGQAACFSMVRGFLLAMQSGRCPKFPSGADTDFVRKVKKRLGTLCTATGADASSSASPALFAGDAIKQMVHDVVNASKAGQKITCATMRPLHQFS